MPAKNCEQLAAAQHAAGRGEEWGREMVRETSSEMIKRCARQRKNKKRRMSPRKRGE